MIDMDARVTELEARLERHEVELEASRLALKRAEEEYRSSLVKLDRVYRMMFGAAQR